VNPFSIIPDTSSEVPVPGKYVEENARQRERLRSLIGRLSDQDLNRPVFGEWTVAGLLAHVAFWDSRGLLLLKKWKKSGVESSPRDVDVLNDAMLPLLLAIPPRKAAEFVLKTAEAIDKEIEELSPDLISEIESKPEHFSLDRARHRQNHIADIESALQISK
jgi:hypothetical protein